MILQARGALITYYAELGTNESVFAEEIVTEIEYPVWYPDDTSSQLILEAFTDEDLDRWRTQEEAKLKQGER